MTFCGRTRCSWQIFLKSLCEARHLACNACGNADVDVYAAAFYPSTLPADYISRHARARARSEVSFGEIEHCHVHRRSRPHRHRRSRSDHMHEASPPAPRPRRRPYLSSLKHGSGWIGTRKTSHVPSPPSPVRMRVGYK